MEFDTAGLFSNQSQDAAFHSTFHHHHQQQQQQQQQQPPQQQQLEPQQQHHAGDLHTGLGGHAGEVSSPEDNKKQRGSGRPRDKIWELYKGDRTATCIYCEWTTDHPKAVRLRQHITEACNHVPPLKKEQVQNWEYDKAQKRASKKASVGGTGASSSPMKKEPEDAANAAIRAHQNGGAVAGPSGSGSGSGGGSGIGSNGKKRRIEEDLVPIAPPPTSSNQEIAVDPGLDGFNALDNALTQTMSNLHRSPVTCHVLDSTAGKPAPGIAVKLEKLNPSAGFIVQATGATDSDGRCSNLLPAHPRLESGVYKMTFYTSDYFMARGIHTFYPFVEIPFSIANPEEHHHIPLLLAPFAYSTYRGS